MMAETTPDRARLRHLCEQAEPACCGQGRQVGEFEQECCGDPDYPVQIEARELTALFDQLDQQAETIQRLETALRPFATFAEKWNAKPLVGIHDEFYSIHAGEDGATLRLSDCRRALASLRQRL